LLFNKISIIIKALSRRNQLLINAYFLNACSLSITISSSFLIFLETAKRSSLTSTLVSQRQITNVRCNVEGVIISERLYQFSLAIVTSPFNTNSPSSQSKLYFHSNSLFFLFLSFLFLSFLFFSSLSHVFFHLFIPLLLTKHVLYSYHFNCLFNIR
jgi:hypothetical protein